jgi:hypothetical protein
VRDVLARNARRLLSTEGVVGVAEGEADGRPCIMVYVAEMTEAVRDLIPPDLEGWPVVVRESGEFRALPDREGPS